MEAKNIAFRFEMRSQVKCILVDRLRFNQIFFNLLSNAVKFTPEGGKIDFLGETIEGEDGTRGICYVVRDNGIGMSEAFMQHIYEPFTQEHTEKTRGTQGTGLGLPIVKSLVEAMGGSISVKSQLGVGTEFAVRLYLPETTMKTRKEAPKENKEFLMHAHVLLVEDNDMNILVARKLLESKGCEVAVARDGLEGVKTFQESEEGFYTVILMDVRMPVMDGIEATKKIRALKRADAKTIPIIAMTADAFLEDQFRTREAGMNAHLSKPIKPDLLFETLNQYSTGKVDSGGRGNE